MFGIEKVWFHEDDYCQIELLPKAAEEFTRQQVGEIDTFAAAHDAGVGWDAMYVRSAPPAALGSLGVTVEALGACVPAGMKIVRRVTTGYSSHVEPAERTVAWVVMGGSPLIFANYDDNNIVQHVWFSGFSRGKVELMHAFLTRCSGQWPLILADWEWGLVVDLSDEGAIGAYLAEKTAPRDK